MNWHAQYCNTASCCMQLQASGMRIYVVDKEEARRAVTAGLTDAKAAGTLQDAEDSFRIKRE